MARNWTPEARARQAAMIRLWSPWKASTGPKTAKGKQMAALNRQKSLEQADADLVAATEKVRRLRGGKEVVAYGVMVISDLKPAR